MLLRSKKIYNRGATLEETSTPRAENVEEQVELQEKSSSGLDGTARRSHKSGTS